MAKKWSCSGGPIFISNFWQEARFLMLPTLYVRAYFVFQCSWTSKSFVMTHLCFCSLTTALKCCLVTRNAVGRIIFSLMQSTDSRHQCQRGHTDTCLFWHAVWRDNYQTYINVNIKTYRCLWSPHLDGIDHVFPQRPPVDTLILSPASCCSLTWRKNSPDDAFWETQTTPAVQKSDWLHLTESVSRPPTHTHAHTHPTQCPWSLQQASEDHLSHPLSLKWRVTHTHASRLVLSDVTGWPMGHPVSHVVIQTRRRPRGG